MPKPPPPFLQRLVKKTEDGKCRRFITMLKQHSINVPLVEALEKMPGYAKFRKDLVTKKRSRAMLKQLSINVPLDSACSRHMTGDKSNFLSLRNFKGGNMAFGYRKSGEFRELDRLGICILMQLTSYTM